MSDALLRSSVLVTQSTCSRHDAHFARVTAHAHALIICTCVTAHAPIKTAGVISAGFSAARQSRKER